VHGQTGLNVPVRDTAALSAALRALLGDGGLREQLGAAARRRYEDEFRAELMVQRMLNLYRRLARE